MIIFIAFLIIFGRFISDINLWELIVAFQVSALWSLTIRKIIINSSIFSLLVFLNPFILNYFTLCTRDSITLSLIFLIGFKGWEQGKTSFCFSNFFHAYRFITNIYHFIFVIYI